MAEALTIEEREWAALIKRICASSGFSKAKKRRGLLSFLFEKLKAPIGEKIIEDEFFKGRLNETSFNQARSRMAAGDLRAKLADYAASGVEKKWCCELPDAQTQDGYQLVFHLIDIPLTASQCFWKPHLDTVEDTLLISGSHLFFFNLTDNIILRYYDFNSQESKKEKIFEALKLAHSECDTRHLVPWHNTYLATGDVRAHEALVRCFHKEKSVLLRRITSREITESEVHRHTPILIGRPQTNPFIETMMNSQQAAQLGYRIHDVKGTIKINGIRPNERTALSRFQISDAGIVGPVTQEGFVFGIVTRMRNPGGYGHVTIIACDYYAMVIARIAEVLTNDKRAAALLSRMDLPLDRALPDTFEMLFSVTLSPGDLEGEGYPELIAWRML